jgi:hypothetical protein
VKGSKKAFPNNEIELALCPFYPFFKNRKHGTKPYDSFEF